MKSEHYQACEKIIRQLYAFYMQGNTNRRKARAIGIQMKTPWDQCSEQEKQGLRVLTRHLSRECDERGQEGDVHGDE